MLGRQRRRGGSKPDNTNLYLIAIPILAAIVAVLGTTVYGAAR